MILPTTGERRHTSHAEAFQIIYGDPLPQGIGALNLYFLGLALHADFLPEILKFKEEKRVPLFIYLFKTSLLEYNCFTMVCSLLLYNKVNQLYVYTYPHIPSLLRLPPTLPIPPL